MLGQIVYSSGSGKIRLDETGAHGLWVLRVSVDPDGFWAKRRLQKAGRLLSRAGVHRVLVPEGFSEWETLERRGLRRVDPLSFLRAQAAPLTLAALHRRGQQPERCAVALRGIRADRDMAGAAEELCPLVKDLCISAQRDGHQLREYLRWEYGIAACPDHAAVDGAVRFDPQTWERGGSVLDLFPPNPGLCSVKITLPGVEQTETEELPLLAALWEVGKVQKRDLEFT